METPVFSLHMYSCLLGCLIHRGCILLSLKANVLYDLLFSNIEASLIETSLGFLKELFKKDSCFHDNGMVSAENVEWR